MTTMAIIRISATAGALKFVGVFGILGQRASTGGWLDGHKLDPKMAGFKPKVGFLV